MPRASKPRPGKARKRTTKRGPAKKRRAALAVIEPVETSEQAIAAIAQDAVLIMRRGLAYHARRALRSPKSVALQDCVALLRLMAELGPAAARGAGGTGVADYSQLSPDELAQYAALSLKVSYGE